MGTPFHFSPEQFCGERPSGHVPRRACDTIEVAARDGAKVDRMRRYLITVGLVFAVAVAQAVTISTHDDPALDGSTPLFTVTNTSVSGSWTGTGLTLEIPVVSMSFNDVKMDMQSVTRSGATLGSGTVKFYTSDINNPIFRVDFDAGSIFEPFVFGGSYLSTQNVTFSGSALSSVGAMSDEQFAFSFANPVTGQSNTYTASFTSSASVVPEPLTLGVLTLGVALAARRRR